MFRRSIHCLILTFAAVVAADEPAILKGEADDPRSPPVHSCPTPASAATTTAPCNTPRVDVATVCSLWNLSGDEKGKRLIKAANDGTVHQLQMLLLAGADVGARDGNRNTALHWAAWEGYVEAARFLLCAGAAVDAGNWAQNTPLHWAAWGGRAAVVRLLAASSADVNARNVDGDTPLHFAAEHGRVEEASILLDAGADRQATNNKGKTPVDRARQFNQQHWIDTLKLQ